MLSAGRLVVVLAALASACGGAATESNPASPPATSKDGKDAPAVPPSVLTADGHLHCTISSKENGTQKLVLQGGQGLEFDVSVSPIVDGVVQQNGPEKGGSYRFSSHLAKPGKGNLSGVGEVTIDELETKVNVEMKRYKQPGGPGTELTFSSEDMAMRGVYIEFAGRATAANGERYAFRVTLGAAKAGSGGKVKPATDANQAPIHSKMVVVQAPQMTVVTTSVTKLP